MWYYDDDEFERIITQINKKAEKARKTLVRSLNFWIKRMEWVKNKKWENQISFMKTYKHIYTTVLNTMSRCRDYITFKNIDEWSVEKLAKKHGAINNKWRQIVKRAGIILFEQIVLRLTKAINKHTIFI